MESFTAITPLVATVFATAKGDDYYEAFRAFLHTHMVSFQSCRLLKNPTSADSLVVTEYCFGFESTEPKDIDALKKSAQEWAKTVNCDVAVQRDDVFRRYKRLIVFDMDSTLIKQEVIDEIALHVDSIYADKKVGPHV